MTFRIPYQSDTFQLIASSSVLLSVSGSTPRWCLKCSTLLGPGLGEPPPNLEFPVNIYTMAEASDFKFGTQLGFAKARHKITP